MLIGHARHAPSAALAERGGCGSCNSEVSAHEELDRLYDERQAQVNLHECSQGRGSQVGTGGSQAGPSLLKLAQVRPKSGPSLVPAG